MFKLLIAGLIFVCGSVVAQTWSNAQIAQKSKNALEMMKDCEADLIWQRPSKKDACIAKLVKIKNEFDERADVGSKYDACWWALTNTVGNVGWVFERREKISDISVNLQWFAAYRNVLSECEKAVQEKGSFKK